jgi:hypothetical protein
MNKEESLQISKSSRNLASTDHKPNLTVDFSDA